LGLQRCWYSERVVRHSIWNMENRLNRSSRFYDWNSCCSILRHRMVLHYKQLHDCNSPVEELGHRNQRSKFDNCNTQNIYNRESVTDYLDKWQLLSVRSLGCVAIFWNYYDHYDDRDNNQHRNGLHNSRMGSRSESWWITDFNLNSC